MPQGEYLQYGGQAIVEGVMMRSPHFFAVACRAPNGEIVLRTEAIESTWIGKVKWLKRPFLRGSLALLDAMALGSRAMKFASSVQMAPEYMSAEEVAEVKASGKAVAAPSKRVQDITIGATMVFAIAFGLFLFNYVPNVIAEFTQRARGATLHATQTNIISEVVKFAIFLGYVGLIGLLPDIRRVFQYHGAEHKAINALEAEQELNLENCLAQTRLHPRCGTSFAIIVLLLGFVVFTFLPRYPITGHATAFPIKDITVRVLMEILILPFIAGIAYELLRLAGKFRNQTFVNLAFKPGIWTQFLTTREPDPSQIEVSLAALKACLDAEKRGTAVAEDDNALESAPMVLPGLQ